MRSSLHSITVDCQPRALKKGGLQSSLQIAKKLTMALFMWLLLGKNHLFKESEEADLCYLKRKSINILLATFPTRREEGGTS